MKQQLQHTMNDRRKFGYVCKAVAVLCLALLLASCQRRHHSVTRGFYYWKTTFTLNAYEQQRLQELHCRRLFLRCFDVGWDEATGQPKPVALLRAGQKPNTAFTYTPVVFITQHAMERSRPAQLPALADHISRLLAATCTTLGISPNEIQVDCDWTQRTRDRYFDLLRALREQPFFQGRLLSCTIRLHQVKFRLRSGLPPVDRGLVMCYNIGNLKQPGAHNSILDAALAKDYLQDLHSYPLPVDIALPLYRWCLQFRGGKLRGILRDVAPEAVETSPLFHTTGRTHLYTCVADTLWQGYALERGDEIRVEGTTVDALRQVADFTANAVRNEDLTVSFFHVDSLTLAKFATHDLEAVYGAYR